MKNYEMEAEKPSKRKHRGASRGIAETESKRGVATDSTVRKKKRKKRKERSNETNKIVLLGKSGEKDTVLSGDSNWKRLKQTLGTKQVTTVTGLGKTEAGHGAVRCTDGSKSETIALNDSNNSNRLATLTKILALDCEMVGGGLDGINSILARVSIVNASGAVIYDSHVAPIEKVTDYRTQWSGVRPRDLVGAPSKAQVVSTVKAYLAGRILVGHALQNDLEALNISHPHTHIRDSAKYPPFMRRLISGKLKPRALRHIVEEELNLSIQTGEHDSIQDARAVLHLYHKHKTKWEEWISKQKNTKKFS